MVVVVVEEERGEAGEVDFFESGPSTGEGERGGDGERGGCAGEGAGRPPLSWRGSSAAAAFSLTNDFDFFCFCCCLLALMPSLLLVLVLFLFCFGCCFVLDCAGVEGSLRFLLLLEGAGASFVDLRRTWVCCFREGCV